MYECEEQKYELDHPSALRTLFFLYITPSPHAWRQLPTLKSPSLPPNAECVKPGSTVHTIGQKNTKKSSYKEAGSPNTMQLRWCWKPRGAGSIFCLENCDNGDAFLPMQHWGN
jgi:hypothetical protein